MATYLTVDFNNMFFRMKHVSLKNSSTEERIGMVMHQMLTGIRSAWKKFDANHCVFALEGSSWRKHIYPHYKMNRVALRLKRTQKEIEIDEEFGMAANYFSNYLKTATNCTVVRSKNAEADDVIATFILDRPNDNHIIVSSDSDFYQLVGDNVCIYDAMNQKIIRHDGIFDHNMKPIIDKKTKKQKFLGDPEYYVFKKCIRGDSSDNIFTAYPRIREKGTKNKIGIEEAFNDRHSKGFEWNTVMLHEWTDHNGETKKVLERYEMNKLLIDLRLIPDFIMEEIRRDIDQETAKSINTQNIGFNFMKFCGKNGLINIANSPEFYLEFLGKQYE